MTEPAANEPPAPAPKERLCSSCRKPGHDARTCPEPPDDRPPPPGFEWVTFSLVLPSPMIEDLDALISVMEPGYHLKRSQVIRRLLLEALSFREMAA